MVQVNFIPINRKSFHKQVRLKYLRDYFFIVIMFVFGIFVLYFIYSWYHIERLDYQGLKVKYDHVQKEIRIQIEKSEKWKQAKIKLEKQYFMQAFFLKWQKYNWKSNT